MRRTESGRLLIVLAMCLAFGCAPRGDWISETLTLADFSGTWEGTLTGGSIHNRVIRSIRMVLKQSGARVTGELVGGGSEGWQRGPIEGVVNGDMFVFRTQEFNGEASVNAAEMRGRADGHFYCPCFLFLRRVGDGGEER
jgi:hypothetical protein